MSQGRRMGPCFQLSIESELFNWIWVSKPIAIHAKIHHGSNKFFHFLTFETLGRYSGDLPRAAHLRCTPPSVCIKVVYLHAFTHTCKRGRVVLVVAAAADFVVCNNFKHSIFLDSKSNDQFIAHCISYVYFMWMWMRMQVCVCAFVLRLSQQMYAQFPFHCVSHLHCNGCCMFWGEYVFFVSFICPLSQCFLNSINHINSNT